MSNNPPLPFDPCSQSDFAGYFDMINSIVGFVAASTNLATKLRSSRCCIPQNIETKQVTDENEHAQISGNFEMTEFPMILDEYNKANDDAPVISNKPPQLSVCEVVPLVQYPLFDLIHGEPNQEPRTFTLIDTKDFGDVDLKRSFKSMVLTGKRVTSINSIPSVEATRAVIKYSSSDSCFFEEYSDSEQTIDSTNLQEYYEKTEEQGQGASAKSTKNKPKGKRRAVDQHNLDSSEEVEQYSTMYQGTEDTSNNQSTDDLYLECTVDGTQSTRNTRSSEEQTLANNNHEVDAILADIMKCTPKFTKTHKDDSSRSDNKKHGNKSMNAVDLVPKTPSKTKRHKSLTIDEEKSVSPTLIDVVELVRCPDKIREGNSSVPKTSEVVRNGVEGEQIECMDNKTNEEKIMNINRSENASAFSEKVTEAINSTLLPMPGSQTEVVVPKRSVKSKKTLPSGKNQSVKTPGVTCKVNEDKLDIVKKLLPRQSSKQQQRTSVNLPTSQTICQETSTARKEPSVAKLKPKLEKVVKKKKDVPTPKAARKYRDEETDYITKNIVNCLNIQKKISSDLKKSVFKGFPSSVFALPKERFSNKTNTLTQQQRSGSVGGETKLQSASRRKSSTADFITLAGPQEIVQKASAKKSLLQDILSKEKTSVVRGQRSVPKLISKMPEARSCSKSPSPGTSRIQKDCLVQDGASTRRPATCGTIKERKDLGIIPKMPLMRDTTLKLTAAQTVRKASELLKNLEKHGLQPTTDAKRLVLSEAAGPSTFHH